jgi:hypothetical protein
LKGFGYWINSRGTQYITREDGCLTTIVQIFTRLFEKDKCFLIIRNNFETTDINNDYNDLNTEYNTDNPVTQTTTASNMFEAG